MTKTKSEPLPDPAELPADLPTLSVGQFDVSAPADGTDAPTTFDPESMRSALDHPQHPLRHLKDA